MYFLNELLKTDCAFLLNVEILASQVFILTFKGQKLKSIGIGIIRKKTG